jgi:pimeloyl-ACP methyl ester carboxylesterase
MTRSPARAVAVITALVLVASSNAFATGTGTSHAPKYTPTYERAPCALGVPSDPTVECGVLTVPENRDRPNRAEVQLPVAIVRSQAPEKAPDPIVQLTGGPGGPAFPIVSFVVAADLGGPRDVIVLSQRGAATSTPNLDCPELADATWAQFATANSGAAEQRTYNAAVRACHARLRESGVDLNSYNTITNAADVADLRVALGIKEWNLWGGSYGTLLAQQVMRAQPDGLRSVVLDSTVPPDRGFGGTERVRRGMAAIEHLLAGCTASPTCAAAHPSLGRDLRDVVGALDAHPYQSVVMEAATGTQRPIAITGKDLITGITLLASDASLIPLFPQLVSQLKAGQYGLIDTLATRLIPTSIIPSEGMFLSVMCADQAHIDVRAGLRRLLAAHPEYEGGVGADGAHCPAWGVRPVPHSFNRRVTSTIPTLVLAGEWDHNTPPKPAQEATKNLERSSFVEFPGLGHVVVRHNNTCPQSIFRGFIASPTRHPDTSCVQEMPELQWQ